MKRILFLLSFLTYTVFSTAQEVLPKQQALITKIAATWCINCGTWGWNTYEGILEENAENALIITAHYNGDLYTKTAKSISDNFGSIGQPQFFLGNELTRLHEGNRVAKQAEIKEAVQTISTQMPVANTGIQYQLKDESLAVRVKTKFFQNTTGEFYVATYILENEVLNFQTGKEAVVAHTKVLRGAFTENDFGIAIGNQSISNGAEFIRNQTVDLSANWDKDNLEVVAIIWKKVGDTYQYVNGSQIQIGDTSKLIDAANNTTTNNTGTGSDFPEFPWLADIIDANNCCNNTKVEVYNSGAHQFVFIEGDEGCSSNQGTLYYQNGTFYCADSPSMDCRTAYKLTEVDLAKSWTCEGTTDNAGSVDMPNDSTTIEEASTNPGFEDFPWLNALVDVENCCNNTKIIAYYQSIFTFIFIETETVCGTSVGSIYFQDGTFYCSDIGTMDCRNAYGLSDDRSSILWSCEMETETPVMEEPPIEVSKPIKYLALGDSYTIGQSVPVDENYPNQLYARFLADDIPIETPTIIARTGWSTGQLQQAINQASLTTDYDLVSLLIGVNNQFRGLSKTAYATEFEALLQRAIAFAKDDKVKVFILSIPDYAYTPFGQNNSNSSRISSEIDEFNAINKTITESYGIAYFDITPISRRGNEETELVATDKLHPSGEQYRQWVEAIYSEVKALVK